MGGGGQPKNTTTTTQTEIPAWLTSDYQSLIGQAQTANQTPYQAYNAPLNASPSSQQADAATIAGAGARYQLPGQQ